MMTTMIKRSKTNPLLMGNNPKKVIDNGIVYEYVGIGWIALRKATKADYKRYPVVEDSE